MVTVPVVPLGSSRHLISLHRQIRAQSAYVITDVVTGSVVICSQTLANAQAYINKLTNDKVSIASLYESAKLNRLVHRRWRVERYTLEEVPQAFEQRRSEWPKATAVVLTFPPAMEVTC